MSGASMNQIKARMKSVGSTMQITRAMELVATSKLPRARVRMQSAEEFCAAYESVLVGLVRDECSVWSRNEGDKVLYVVIAGDRGLAGGYNSGVLRLAAIAMEENSIVVPWGKKAMDAYAHKRNALLEGGAALSELDMSACMETARRICRGFLDGEYGRVEVIYTRFVSMLSQQPTRQTVLPFEVSGRSGEAYDAVTDNDREGLIDAVMPEYLGSVLYSALCHAAAAESAARRTAMNSANKNAREMIQSLTQNYNRARQAVITGEIIDIVSGAGAP